MKKTSKLLVLLMVLASMILCVVGCPTEEAKDLKPHVMDLTNDANYQGYRADSVKSSDPSIVSISFKDSTKNVITIKGKKEGEVKITYKTAPDATNSIKVWTGKASVTDLLGSAIMVYFGPIFASEWKDASADK